jgi:Do/DeqQ family serine protease
MMHQQHLQSSSPTTRWFAIGLSLIVAASGSLCLAKDTTSSSSTSDIDLARHLENAFEKVAEQTSPSVVVITTKRKVGEAMDLQDGEDEDNGDGQQFKGTPFEYFFRRMPHTPQLHQPERDVEGQGSGVILRKDGYILTNMHVINGADSITVLLKDGTKFENAKVIGVDERIDVAVIKVDAKDLPAAKLANSDEVKVGQWAMAIGAPYELDYSFTVGFVSAKGRTGVWSRGSNAYEDYIQTDAAINPGNSGGPLCDIEGRVIGINTLIRGLNRGIGFAIPINMAMESAEKLIKDGKVTRPWIGIGIEALSDNKDLLERVKPLKEGVVVNLIEDGAPASKSDLTLADIIVSVDGVSVKTPRDLQRQILHKQIGQKVMLDVVRDDKTVKIALQTGEMPDELRRASHERETPIEPKVEGAFGLTVQTLTKDLAEHLKLEVADGVVVTDVADGSAADREGLKRGDVITAIDRAPTHSADDFKAAVAKVDPAKGVLLYVHRGRSSVFVVLKETKE